MFPKSVTVGMTERNIEVLSVRRFSLPQATLCFGNTHFPFHLIGLQKTDMQVMTKERLMLASKLSFRIYRFAGRIEMRNTVRSLADDCVTDYRSQTR